MTEHVREHDGGTGHDHDAGHGHPHAHGWVAQIKGLFIPHSHDASDRIDSELETSREGTRTLLISFVGLFATAIVQAVIVAVSGSVALLGDTIHNLADALTAAPLAVAFTLGRRAATRRYTYGYGRSEDLAGIAVVLVIAASAAVAAYEAIVRLLHPQHVGQLGLVAAAGVVGFIGNEVVARYRIGVGRRIGSAALVADGLHARTDGFTSLAVVVGAGGVALGWQWADPVVGLVITVAILAVLRGASREIYRRLMDAVDPALVGQVESAARNTAGVQCLGEVRLRWIGHSLRAELEIQLDRSLDLIAAHDIAENVEHQLLHQVPRLTSAIVHADPAGHQAHARLDRHRQAHEPKSAS